MQNGKSIKISREDFNPFIFMLERMDEPWGIKDLEHRHVYMNAPALTFTNTPVNFDIEGRLDSEFPVAWSELHEQFINHDILAINNARRVAVIETHYWYGESSMSPYFCEKMPIYDAKKQCIGIMWNVSKFNSISPLKYIKQQKPSVLTTEVTTTIFTKKELNIIFFLMQKLTNKEIAKILKIPQKTIENKICIIYQKAGTAFFKVIVACSLFYATRIGVIFSRSGLSITAPTGLQFRVFPDQRSGWLAFACL